MEFIIVTGLSGAGKTKSINAFEDMGFYCVDNIPSELLSIFYELCEVANDESKKKVAVVIDIRAGKPNNFIAACEKLKDENKKYKIIFLDAKDEVLVNRFIETRRRHPLAKINLGSILKSVQYEREIFGKIKEIADYVIDTSDLSTSQLKTRISDMFLKDNNFAFTVTCLSFGFKHGIPTEANILLDVRCLPNPYYVKGLKKFTGLDQEVIDYVFKWDQTKGFIQHLTRFIDYLLPLYKAEGKNDLVIAIGCTGGKHRSVAIAQFLHDYLIEKNQPAIIQHRDIGRE